MTRHTTSTQIINAILFPKILVWLMSLGVYLFNTLPSRQKKLNPDLGFIGEFDVLWVDIFRDFDGDYDKELLYAHLIYSLFLTAIQMGLIALAFMSPFVLVVIFLVILSIGIC